MGFYKVRLCIVCFSFAYGVAKLNAAEQSPPNIVLIMCDDMGFSDIGCYGGEVETTHLDRLAREGARFTQFYNNAKCTTTRASLVTGTFPRWPMPHLRSDMVTLGEIMREAGYSTSLSGKWHLGRDPQTHPHHRGFQEFYGLLDGCCNFFDPSIQDPPYKGSRVRFFAHNLTRVREFPEDYYTTDAFTDHAIECIRRADTAEQPFFVHLTYTAPHYPLHAKPQDIEKYRGRFSMGWDRMRQQRWDRIKELGLATSAWNLSAEDSKSYSWETADQQFEDERMAVYAAMIDCMDQNIGRLLEVLKETNHDQDTLVLFFSDNGGCAEEPGGRNPEVRHAGPADDYVAVGPAWGWAQNAPFRRYKSWLHEGGITTPMIAWWPGNVPAGSINRSPTHIVDIMPTFIELIGSQYPDAVNGEKTLPLDGESMLPVLRGENRQRQKPLAWYWAGNRAYRDGDWKLVWDKLGEKQWELYDLSQDRCETQDLAAGHVEIVERMSTAWLAWAKETGLEIKE